MADGRLRRVKLAFERDYTQIPNEWLRDSSISLGARGLLCLLMSHREGYVVTYKTLAATNPEGMSALLRIVQELKEQQYLAIHKERGANGRILGYVWELTDPKQEKRRSTPYLDIPDLGKPDLDKPDLDNHVLKEAQLEEHSLLKSQPGHSTGAGVEEDASGDSPQPAAETPAERYQRLIHQKCPARQHGRPHHWEPSDYCTFCGNPMPDDVRRLLRPEPILEEARS